MKQNNYFLIETIMTFPLIWSSYIIF